MPGENNISRSSTLGAIFYEQNCDQIDITTVAYMHARLLLTHTHTPWYSTSSFVSLSSQIAIPPSRSVSSMTFTYQTCMHG